MTASIGAASRIATQESADCSGLIQLKQVGVAEDRVADRAGSRQVGRMPWPEKPAASTSAHCGRHPGCGAWCSRYARPSRSRSARRAVAGIRAPGRRVAAGTSPGCRRGKCSRRRQQAVVRGDAEVVRHKLVVDGAGAAREQRAGQLRIERRGGHLIKPTGSRRFASGGSRRSIGVAGQYQHVAAHLAFFSACHITSAASWYSALCSARKSARPPLRWLSPGPEASFSGLSGRHRCHAGRPGSAGWRSTGSSCLG